MILLPTLSTAVIIPMIQEVDEVVVEEVDPDVEKAVEILVEDVVEVLHPLPALVGTAASQITRSLNVAKGLEMRERNTKMM
jgi:hypothetical protein